MIKERSKEARDRSRSRSRSQVKSSGESYATVVGRKDIRDSNAFTREGHVKVVSSITFALMAESTLPGSFHETIEEMYKLNNLPKVKFPDYIPPLHIDSSQIEEELSKMRSHYKSDKAEPENTVNSETAEIMEVEREKDKRKRGTPSPIQLDIRQPKSKARKELAQSSLHEEESSLHRSSGKLSIPQQEPLTEENEEGADNESIPELETEELDTQENYMECIADMNSFFIAQKETVI